MSGSSGHFYRQKRKEKKEKEDDLLKKIPRLNTFFSSSSASTSTIQSTENPEATKDGDGETESRENSPPLPRADREQHYMDTDPGLWNVTPNLVDYWCKRGISDCQNREKDGIYAASRYKDGTEYRSLTNNMFTRKMMNGENVQRDWLIYSPSLGKIYCFQCKLFSNDPTQLATTGFSDWKHASARLCSHENSQEHAKAMAIWITRNLQNIGRESGIDTSMEQQFRTEKDYWQAVLRRVVEAVKFLAERGLAFFGDNQELGSPNNGNFLGVLEFLAKFDPFLADHLAKHGNKGSGHTSYLSSDICTEFINLMGKKVRGKIIDDIIAAKYFAISVDSTPDITHTDQLAIIARYVNPTGQPVERFLTYLPNVGHTGGELAEATLEYLKSIGLDIANCRGQSYDNASAMCGKYTGMQAHIKRVNEKIELVPCGAHSLNLVGQHAAESCLEAVSFFGVVQEVYVFFSASTARWKLLTDLLDGELVPKRLSDTRWSARYEAVRALTKGYTKIYAALNNIKTDVQQKAAARAEALGIMKRMESLEMVMMTFIWNDILSRFHPVSKLLQSIDIDLSRAVELLSSLIDFTNSIRSEFQNYEESAKSVAINAEYKQTSQRLRKRPANINDGDAVEAVLDPAKKFQVETFIPIIDTIQAQLSERLKSYDLLANRFDFLHKFHSMTQKKLSEKAESLVKFYPEDLSLELVSEIGYLPIFVKEQEFSDEKPLTSRSLLKYILSSGVGSVFPNVLIALRIYLCMFCSNCTGERSFSKLKRIKGNLRSTMTQQKLTSLAVMSIESDVLRDLKFDDIISDFAHSKARKHVCV